MDVASKMPLLIAQLLPTKAEHNSRKNATSYGNAMLKKFKGVWQFFACVSYEC
jgi:hypothetical protein